MHARLRAAVAAAIWAYAAAVVGLLGALELGTDRWWPATLIAFAPRWPWALPLLALVPAAAIGRRRMLAPLAAASGVLLFGVLDLRLGLGARAPGEGERPLRLATFNAGNTPALDLRALLDGLQADVVLLQECPPTLADAPPPGWTGVRHFMACLFSRWRPEVMDPRDPKEIWEAYGNGVINRYEIVTPAGRLNVVNVHLETVREGLEPVLHRRLAGVPELEKNIAQRDLESRLARAWSRRGGGALVVAGDFNLPAESAIFKRHWGDLDSAFERCGRGFGSTKTTRWHGVRIDHVLLGPGWRCLRARTGEGWGGDHRPLIVDLVPAR
jgi:endonuclease/exonuclease/phosphatase (EEP) superfamily protein YafD